MSRFDDIYPLFREYDMYAQTVDELKPPNVYKVLTPYGSFVCKRTRVSAQKLLLVSGVLRHLQQRGWDGAVPYCYTKYDEPYVQQGETTYYLTVWMPGGELWDNQPLAWATPTVERLAELHHLTQNFRFDDPRQVEPLIDSLLKRWQHLLAHAEKAADLARERLYPSPFDVVFLANQAYVSELAQTAIARLRDWRERHQTHAHFRLSLIHGFPHPAHIMPDRSGKGKLLNFDRALFDTPTRDLTLFYRAYFHQAGDAAGASQLFHHYTSIFPLRPDEIDLLSIFLTYPERVMRDIEIYYGGMRDWNELYAVKRLEKDIDRLMRLNRWVQQAF